MHHGLSLLLTTAMNHCIVGIPSKGAMRIGTLHPAINHRSILERVEGLKELNQRYRAFAAREETIAREIEELSKPPKQRKPRSSIVWQTGDGTTCGL
jgi:hypothetical protein